MRNEQLQIPRRTMHEWTFRTDTAYVEPFVDVVVRASFTSPSGVVSTMEGFHDGDSSWRVRFNPGEVGNWSWQLTSTPPNPDFERLGTFDVSERESAGFLKSTPGKAWGFARESGEPVLIVGDTVYHLFGMAHNSSEGFEAVKRFMRRRRDQGFNLLRVRLPVSPFHPVDGYSVWQTTSLWPWGGSSQAPRFDRFNLDYFRTVDTVMAYAEELGLGIEMIMQGWGFEFPFSARNVFVAEWEELWTRYLIARYDAYGATWFWQLHNEYEYYPNGDWHRDWTGVSERWAIRMAHLVRRFAPHGHPIAIHNGPTQPSFGHRFRADPLAIDTVMYQAWGSTGEHDAWLAAGLDDEIRAALGDWPGSAVLAEWGYEFNPDLPPMMLGHRFLDEQHTRRGAWRGVMSGLGIIHGWENSWGPFQELDDDLPGVEQIQIVQQFFTSAVPFAGLAPVAGLASGQDAPGMRPLVLANTSRSLIVVYLPVGGTVTVAATPDEVVGEWFDPRIGTTLTAMPSAPDTWSAPNPVDPGKPDDWVLIIRRDRSTSDAL